MNSTTRFDSQFRPDLSLRRREGLATRAPMESMESQSPMQRDEDPAASYGQAALQSAWDKLYRARSILEAEQAHIRDDRIVFQGEIDSLEAREQAVAGRELRIRQIELQMALDIEDERDAKESASTISKLTRAPFDLARSVFGAKK